MIKKPMLAGILEDLKLLKYPVFCTPKLDGIRCLIVNHKAVTRKFKPVPNHYIRNYLEANALEFFDGELVVKGLPFNKISSAVMSEEGTPNFTYVVFDYYSEIEGYNNRMRNLSFAPKIDHIEYLFPVQINNESEFLAYETKVLSEGYEGVMIRNPNGKYKSGRSTPKEGDLLKFKRFYDSEAIILGFEEKMHNENEATEDAFGYTERSSHQENKVPANTLGAFLVKEVETGMEFKIGTGMDDELRQEVWDHKNEYIGQMVKYKAQKVGEVEKPRFPSFIGFRDKRDM